MTHVDIMPPLELLVMFGSILFDDANMTITTPTNFADRAFLVKLTQAALSRDNRCYSLKHVIAKDEVMD